MAELQGFECPTDHVPKVLGDLRIFHSDFDRGPEESRLFGLDFLPVSLYKSTQCLHTLPSKDQPGAWQSVFHFHTLRIKVSKQRRNRRFIPSSLHRFRFFELERRSQPFLHFLVRFHFVGSQVFGLWQHFFQHHQHFRAVRSAWCVVGCVAPCCSRGLAPTRLLEGYRTQFSHDLEIFRVVASQRCGDAHAPHVGHPTSSSLRSGSWDRSSFQPFLSVRSSLPFGSPNGSHPDPLSFSLGMRPPNRTEAKGKRKTCNQHGCSFCCPNRLSQWVSG
mmetsp:Transcript_8116/g.50217  ORF Transcript_8116/g.50217 Transcript_8116/m.50217 type:complete len:275 (+) Transcript_8116:2503-3327(+)